MPVAREHVTLSIAGHEVSISNPSKVLFPDAGITKLDVVHYYLAVAEGALRGAGDRPNVLVRYANGITGEFFYQKRAPAKRPPWVDVATIAFPSGRTADEVVPRDAATLAWMANLGCLELHPHPVRTDDLEHPDELRVDLDPMPGIPWSQIVTVAGLVRDVLADVELVGWPKTSGSRGIHVNVRIARHWTFGEVRRAALALAREVERRAPELVTTPVVEGGAPRRLHRLQPECQGSHRRERILDPRETGCSRVGTSHLGRARIVSTRGVHTPHHAGALRAARRSTRRHR